MMIMTMKPRKEDIIFMELPYLHKHKMIPHPIINFQENIYTQYLQFCAQL